MEWLQFLITIITIGTFLWMARSDYRHLDAKIDANHKETHAKIDANHKDMEQLMRDFHGRLCAIEEKRNRILMGDKWSS